MVGLLLVFDAITVWYRVVLVDRSKATSSWSTYQDGIINSILIAWVFGSDQNMGVCSWFDTCNGVDRDVYTTNVTIANATVDNNQTRIIKETEHGCDASLYTFVSISNYIILGLAGLLIVVGLTALAVKTWNESSSESTSYRNVDRDEDDDSQLWTDDEDNSSA